MTVAAMMLKEPENFFNGRFSDTGLELHTKTGTFPILLQCSMSDSWIVRFPVDTEIAE